jgi:hypothetical protein
VIGRRISLLLALAPLVLAGWDSDGGMSISRHGQVLRAQGDDAIASDPPLLVPWRRTGDIWLGESKARVEAEYGRVHHDAVGNLFYRLHGSKVLITYGDRFYGDAGRIRSIDLMTPYYRTRTGFGVGSKIPLGACHRTATNPCEHRWRGFVYSPYLRESRCRCWVKVGVGPRSLPVTGRNFTKPWFFIYVNHGRVSEFYFSAHYID